MSGNVAVSKLRLMMLVRGSATSLTQSFKSLTGTLSRPVALVVDIEFICFLTKQFVSGDGKRKEQEENWLRKIFCPLGGARFSLQAFYVCCILDGLRKVRHKRILLVERVTNL